MKIRPRLLITTAMLATLIAATPAQARGPGGPHGGHGGYGGGHGHGGWQGGGHGHQRGYGWGPGPLFWGAVGLGIGLNAYYGRSSYPGYVVLEQPAVVVVQESPAVVQQTVSTAAAQAQAQAQAQAAADPVIYPRNGQSAAQIDKDRQECVQWAVAQPRALADASVYQRAIAACMDGRGYSLR